jgi:hypothetical protein
MLTLDKINCTLLTLPGLLFLSLCFHLLHLHGVWLASPHEQVMVPNAKVQDLHKKEKEDWSAQAHAIPHASCFLLRSVYVSKILCSYMGLWADYHFILNFSFSCLLSSVLLMLH